MLRKCFKRGILFGIGLMFMMPTINAYAWGGYAHWEISNRVPESMTTNQRLYYNSASIVADIGRLNWDNKYTVSDSLNFSDTILKIANEDKKDKDLYFAKGWMAHYIQDNKGAVGNIQGGPSSYRVKCGWVDEYLRDDKKIQTPINGKSDFFVNYDIIRKVYAKLDEFTPTDSQIDSELKTIFFAYDLQILSNIKGWTSNDKINIEREIDRVSLLCLDNGILNNEGKSTNELQKRTKEKIEDTSKVYNIFKETLEELKRNNSITFSSKQKNEEGINIVDYSINDINEYEATLNNVNKRLNELGISINDILN